MQIFIFLRYVKARASVKKTILVDGVLSSVGDIGRRSMT